MAQANSDAVANDTVNLFSGNYSTGINPSNSGNLGQPITFQAAIGETPVFTGSSLIAISFINRDYIVVDGISISNVSRFFIIINGSDNNIIKNSSFENATEYSCGLISCSQSTGDIGTCATASTNNWIHNNTFTKYGSVACNDDGTIRIGLNANDLTRNNTISNNTFSYGGHDNFDLGGQYNIVVSNVFFNNEAFYNDPGGCSNSPDSGYFGNRNLIITNYGSGAGNTSYNLIESNRVGHAGTPPDDDGAFGIENAGEKTIIRYNFVYNNGAAGIYGKGQGTGPQNMRVFNNSVYYNGYGDTDLLSNYKNGILIWCWSGNVVDDVQIKNNIAYNNNGTNIKFNVPAYCTNSTITSNLETNPEFVNPVLNSPTSLTLPDLRLQSSSIAAINGGTHLTTVHADDTGSGTTLKVEDALYFQDGTWGSSLAGHTADWICVGATVAASDCFQIGAINYTNNTIAVADFSRSPGEYVWLYKKSDGAQVLYGSAPDYGAYEYVSDVTSIPAGMVIGGGGDGGGVWSTMQ